MCQDILDVMLMMLSKNMMNVLMLCNNMVKDGDFFSWFVKLIMIFTCQFCCLGQIEFLLLICIAVYSISWHSNYVDLELAITIGQSM